MREVEAINPFFSDLDPEVVDFIRQNPPDREAVNSGAFDLWKKGSPCNRTENWNLATVMVGLENYQKTKQEKTLQEESRIEYEVFAASS